MNQDSLEEPILLLKTVSDDITRVLEAPGDTIYVTGVPATGVPMAAGAATGTRVKIAVLGKFATPVSSAARMSTVDSSARVAPSSLTVNEPKTVTVPSTNS